jgi:hypothetical protein
LSGADLQGTQLQGAYCHECNFDRANLSRANFLEANLQRASFNGSTSPEPRCLRGSASAAGRWNSPCLEFTQLKNAVALCKGRLQKPAHPAVMHAAAEGKLNAQVDWPKEPV